MLLKQEFNDLTDRYHFNTDEEILAAFVWSKAEQAQQESYKQEDQQQCTDIETAENKRTDFSTEEIQKYYSGFSYLPKDKAQAKITASEAQFLSSLLKVALNTLEEVKKYDKHKAEVIWQMCDGTPNTVDYYIELKQHLNRKDKTKKQANKLAAIQKKLKVIASS